MRLQGGYFTKPQALTGATGTVWRGMVMRIRISRGENKRLSVRPPMVYNMHNMGVVRQEMKRQALLGTSVRPPTAVAYFAEP